MPQMAFASVKKEPLLAFTYNKDLASQYEIKRKAYEEEEKRQELLTRLVNEVKARYHTVTAYSSTVWQTDANPFITAAGTRVRNGIVAANTLPFGTKIMIPEVFGKKVFTVEDRMAPKNYHKIDIWFPTVREAREFGVKRAKILVLPAELANSVENPTAS